MSSDNQNQNNAFNGIEKLDEFTRQSIIDNAQYQVDRVNSETQRAIQAAKEEQCSAWISAEIGKAGRITHANRMKIVDRGHKMFKVHEYSGGN